MQTIKKLLFPIALALRLIESELLSQLTPDQSDCRLIEEAVAFDRIFELISSSHSHLSPAVRKLFASNLKGSPGSR
jgi:hypothetical protein